MGTGWFMLGEIGLCWDRLVYVVTGWFMLGQIGLYSDFRLLNS